MYDGLNSFLVDVRVEHGRGRVIHCNMRVGVVAKCRDCSNETPSSTERTVSSCCVPAGQPAAGHWSLVDDHHYSKRHTTQSTGAQHHCVLELSQKGTAACIGQQQLTATSLAATITPSTTRAALQSLTAASSTSTTPAPLHALVTTLAPLHALVCGTASVGQLVCSPLQQAPRHPLHEPHA